MKAYINIYQTDSNQEILQPVFFSKDNATRQLQILARIRNMELRNQAVVTQMHIIDCKQAKIHFANKTETFETKELETKDISYIAESIIKKETFPITCVSKEDLESRGFDTSSVTDSQMERLANKMEDDYVEQMYWESLDIIAENLDIPKKKETFKNILPKDGSEIDISDQNDAPSWTFHDDDGNAYTDRATAVRLRDGKVEVRWEGGRCNPANWEPLEWIADDDDYDDFKEGLTECVKYAIKKDNDQ